MPSGGGELVAVELAWLVGVDDRRLRERAPLPLPHVGMAEQRFGVRAGHAARSDAIRAKAKCHRRIEAVGDRIAAAEEGAARAEPAARLLPDTHHALDV